MYISCCFHQLSLIYYYSLETKLQQYVREKIKKKLLVSLESEGNECNWQDGFHKQKLYNC